MFKTYKQYENGGKVLIPKNIKCPDLEIDGIFYEFENYTPPFRKIKISHMLNSGFKQSDRIIIKAM